MAALKKLYSNNFEASLLQVSNPYGEGGASQKVLEILEKFEFKLGIKKKFFDLPTK